MNGEALIATIKKSTSPLQPDDVDSGVWADFVKLRKTKKAAVTGTAIIGLRREADKAGYTLQQVIETCCQRGWCGFNADWVNNGDVTETQYQRACRERVEEFAPSIARKKSGQIRPLPSILEIDDVTTIECD